MPSDAAAEAARAAAGKPPVGGAPPPSRPRRPEAAGRRVPEAAARDAAAAAGRRPPKPPPARAVSPETKLGPAPGKTPFTALLKRRRRPCRRRGEQCATPTRDRGGRRDPAATPARSGDREHHERDAPRRAARRSRAAAATEVAGPAQQVDLEPRRERERERAAGRAKRPRARVAPERDGADPDERARRGRERRDVVGVDDPAREAEHDRGGDEPAADHGQGASSRRGGAARVPRRAPRSPPRMASGSSQPPWSPSASLISRSQPGVPENAPPSRRRRTTCRRSARSTRPSPL